MTITLQIDIDGTGLWVDDRSFAVPAGESLTYEFPEAFSACWLRVVSDRSTTATCTLLYQ